MIDIGLLPDAVTAHDLAVLAAPLQARPDRFQAYFGDDIDEITAEIEEIPDWRSHTVVATDGDRLAGWLIAEHDDEIGRVWWWGPVIDDAQPWREVATALLDHASTGSAARFEQFEFAVDARHGEAIALAVERGHRRDVGSVLLSIDRLDHRSPADAPDSVVIGEIDDGIADQVARLHDAIFADTHLTGRQLVDGRDDLTLAATTGGRPVGYLRAEVQPGGEGYIDFLGVDPDARGAGIGGSLVEAALTRLDDRGVTSASLTVRQDNEPAVALYARLGFDGSRVLVPLRLGFRT